MHGWKAKLSRTCSVAWRELRVVALPIFYRALARDARENVIAVRIFDLPEGRACVVSWPLPEPGLRAFSPSPSEPDGVRAALPYAVFLAERVDALRISVELDPGIEWDPGWGDLRDMVQH